MRIVYNILSILTNLWSYHFTTYKPTSSLAMVVNKM